MRYEKEILRVLMKAGSKGLPIYKIARHVFNACNSLFGVIRYEEVYKSVYRYIKQNAGGRNSIITKSTETQGNYAVNLKLNDRQQLIAWFSDTSVQGNDDGQDKRQEDLSLPLFQDYSE